MSRGWVRLGCRLLLHAALAVSLSGCADSIRNTLNGVAVAIGCHLPRESDVAACRRLSEEDGTAAP